MLLWRQTWFASTRFLIIVFSSSRLPYVFGTRFLPAIYLCGPSPDCLRRLLSRSDCPWWGVSPPCCHRQPGTVRLFRSWQESLTLWEEVMAYPSVRLSQGDRCLIKIYSVVKEHLCRRNQTITALARERTKKVPSMCRHRKRSKRAIISKNFLIFSAGT